MSGNQVAEASVEYRMVGEGVPAGYKMTEVGVIPEDWEVKPIGQLCSYQNGTAQESRFNPHEGYKVVSIGNYSEDGKFIPSESYISRSRKSEVSKFVLNAGDLAMILNDKTSVGTIIGRVILIESDDAYVMNQRTMRLTSRNEIKPDYLHKLINSNFIHKKIVGLAKPGTQIYVNTDDVLTLEVPYPSDKHEQTAIANALSDVDTLINGLEKLITKKQAIKTATMQQLLTGRTRLPQFALREDGTPKGYKPSELGEVPEDWSDTNMGTLGSTYGGLTGKSKADFGHGNALYVPFTNVMSNVVVDIDVLEKVAVSESQNEVIKNDLLFNGSSETPEEVCFCSLVNDEVNNLYLNSFCFGFRSRDTDAYMPLYLAYWFRSEVGRAAVSIMAQGSTRYNISKSQFMKMPIVLPSMEEQTAIATILSDMDEEIQALQQRLSKTRQIKQGMMQELLTGRTRLV